MNHERYQQLQWDEKAELTREEIADGWHFCHKFYGLLTQGELGPGKCCCGTFADGKWSNLSTRVEPEATPPQVTGPQSIEAAPKGGTVILSDCGFCRWIAFQGQPAAWLKCDPEGCISMDRYEDAFECSPTFWTTVPDWIKG